MATFEGTRRSIIPARLRNLIAPSAKASTPERRMHAQTTPAYLPINKENLLIANGASLHMVSNEGDIEINDGKLFVEFMPENGSVTIDMTALKQPEIILKGDHHLKRYPGIGIHGHPGHIFSLKGDRPQNSLAIQDMQLEIWDIKNYLGDDGLAIFERQGRNTYFKDAFIPDHISMVVRWQAGRSMPRGEREYNKQQYLGFWRMFMAHEASKMAFNLTKNPGMTAEAVDRVHELFDQTFALNMGTQAEPKIVRPDLRKHKPEDLRLPIQVVREKELVS